MPRLSDTMTEGTVATWLKKVGDKVSDGDILAEIETDKATMEFESFNSGTLLYIGINEGESAPVDSVLAIIGPDGTDVSGIADNYKADADAPVAESKSEDEPAENKEVKPSSDAPVSDSSASSNDTGRVFASPLARKIAKDKGVNLDQVKGTG